MQRIFGKVLPGLFRGRRVKRERYEEAKVAVLCAPLKIDSEMLKKGNKQGVFDGLTEIDGR